MTAARPSEENLKYLVDVESIASIIKMMLVWLQPIFWMLFFRYNAPNWKSKKLLRVLYVPIILLVINEVFELSLFPWLPNRRLLILYSCMSLFYTDYLMDHDWPLPQAMSASTLLAFIGSFYWELPLTIYNAFKLGFEYDWFLHIIVLFPLWYMLQTVGLRKTLVVWKKLALFLLGLAVTIVTVLLFPVPITTESSVLAAYWDSLNYIFVRMIGILIVFYQFNSDYSKVKIA